MRSKIRLFAIFLLTFTIKIGSLQEQEMCLLSVSYALFVVNNV